jgi:hypothetical protein
MTHTPRVAERHHAELDAAVALASTDINARRLPDPRVLDPWFLAGAISGADSRRVSGQVTSTLSGTPRADVRRLQIPVLSIETQRPYSNAYRRIAEFETLVLQAAERSSDIARELASGLVNQTLEPEPELDH